jgi:hypothetical protein
MSRKNVKTKYYSYCLKNEIPKGVEYLRSKSVSKIDGSTKTLRTRVIRRFVQKSDLNRRISHDEFINELIYLYRNYYLNGLLDKRKIGKFGNKLKKQVLELCTEHDIKVGKNPKWEMLDKKLKAEIEGRGYYCLMGVVNPYRSLIVWENEKTKTFNIRLPNRVKKIKVVLCEDFKELGWMGYATFNRYYVGGWAAKDKIYCVCQAWKMGSEKFKISFLAHEAQHFDDYDVFPNLAPTDLEFRAKLVEIILSSRPNQIIKKFFLEAAKDKKNPHAYASFKIIENISKRSGYSAAGLTRGNVKISANKLKNIAEEILSDHTDRLLRFKKRC